MIKKIIIITIIILIIIIVYPFQTQTQSETFIKFEPSLIIQQNIPEFESKPKPINPAYSKVADITGWDIEIATYFVDEAKLRNVSVFEEALPIATIESDNTYRFDLVNHNKNGTTDKGLLQINDVTLPDIIKGLKAEGREFKSWDRKNPYFNIAAGIYYIAYLKDTYNIKGNQLFSSYNRGALGARRYASRYGTYETAYSRRIKEIKKELTNY